MIRFLILSFAVIILLASCAGKTTIGPATTDTLLAQFDNIDPDGLHVYSPCDTVDGNKYLGKLIDPAYYKYISFGDNMEDFTADTSDHAYSCYKFKLSENKTGLIIRRPGEYDASAVDLYIWDDTAKRVTGIVPLADAFGDGDWFFARDAWFANINNDDALDIVTREKDYEQDDTDSTKTTQADSLFVYLASDNGFYIKTAIAIDANKFQLFNWIRN